MVREGCGERGSCGVSYIAKGEELVGAGEEDDKRGEQDPRPYGCGQVDSGLCFNPLLQARLGSSVFGTHAATSGTAVSPWVAAVTYKETDLHRRST
jgi:hypothetical protein